jgi:hypothetical protein
MRRLLSSLIVSARFSVREILDLAASGSPEAESRIETIFGWYHERSSTTVRGLLRTAGAIAVAFLAAAISEKADIKPWHVGVGSGVATFLILAAIWTNWHLGHLQREFVTSIRLLRGLEPHEADLAAYVRRTGGRE